jgi:hypothetical protein
MIAGSLNIPTTVVLRVLKDYLGKRKLRERFVPHSLTPGQREDRVTSCRGIAMADADNFFLIITGDETWCFAYDPETKRHSSEWVSETYPGPKNLKCQRSRIKTMLINFFSTFKAQCTKFVPEGKPVNAELYKGVMDRPLKRIKRVRPAAFCSWDFLSLHDNAPAHKAASVLPIFDPENVTTLYHPPYFPDLSPPDYFLFPSWKLS